MTEKILAAKHLIEKLNGGLEIHCDCFRHVKGMKSATAERRLREWRHEFDLYFYDKPWPKGCGYQVDGDFWVFQRRFVKWLGQQVRAAERVEQQKLKNIKGGISPEAYQFAAKHGRFPCVTIPVIK